MGLPWSGFEARARLRDGSARSGVLVTDSESDQQVRLHELDPVYEATELEGRPQKRRVHVRRRKVAAIERDDVGAVRVRFDDGTTMTAQEAGYRIATCWRWSRTSHGLPDRRDFGVEWETWADLRDVSDLPQPDSVHDLTLERLSGRGSQTRANEFLEGGPEEMVDHTLGYVEGYGFKTGFMATYRGNPVALAVVGTHPHPDHQGDAVTISRLACHPVRPANTLSWLISKVRWWARAAGYDEIVCHSGATQAPDGDPNAGHVYKHAGFEYDEDRSGWADGSARTREGRREYCDGGRWYRHVWYDDLDPMHNDADPDRIIELTNDP